MNKNELIENYLILKERYKFSRDNKQHHEYAYFEREMNVMAFEINLLILETQEKILGKLERIEGIIQHDT